MISSTQILVIILRTFTRNIDGMTDRRPAPDIKLNHFVSETLHSIIKASGRDNTLHSIMEASGRDITLHSIMNLSKWAG